MSEFRFTKEHVDHHVESIGIDVRPPVEIKLDRARIQEFYNLVSEEFPNLFENLVQGPEQFRILKVVPIPGKGQIEVPTFTLTKRGPVFSFPRRFAGSDELSWPWPDSANADVIKCLGIFRKNFPMTKCVRIGKIRHLIFMTGESNSDAIVRERFCHAVPADSAELGIAWNQADEQYNRKIQVRAVRKQSVSADSTGRMIAGPAGEYGIEVKLDINNTSLEKPLDPEQMAIILRHADSFFIEDLLGILNGGGAE